MDIFPIPTQKPKIKKIRTSPLIKRNITPNTWCNVYTESLRLIDSGIIRFSHTERICIDYCDFKVVFCIKKPNGIDPEFQEIIDEENNEMHYDIHINLDDLAYGFQSKENLRLGILNGESLYLGFHLSLINQSEGKLRLEYSLMGDEVRKNSNHNLIKRWHTHLGRVSNLIEPLNVNIHKKWGNCISVDFDRDFLDDDWEPTSTQNSIEAPITIYIDRNAIDNISPSLQCSPDFDEDINDGKEYLHLHYVVGENESYEDILRRIESDLSYIWLKE